MAVTGVVLRPSVSRQVARGVGWTVAVLVVPLTLLTLGSWLVGSDSYADVAAPRRWAAGVVVAALVGACLVVRHRLRAWSDRPRWLMVVVGVLAAAAAVPAAAAPASELDSAGGWCTPVLDSWRPAMAAPAASDTAYWSKVNFQLRSPDPTNRAVTLKYLAYKETLRRSPAYRRADAYVAWSFSADSCSPRSRTVLGADAAAAGLAAAAVAVTVRRRRRV